MFLSSTTFGIFSDVRGVINKLELIVVSSSCVGAEKNSISEISYAKVGGSVCLFDEVLS